MKKLVKYMPKKIVLESISDTFKKQDITIEELEQQIKKYFRKFGVKLTNNFSLEEFAKSLYEPIGKASILLQNLVNKEVMQDIANGDYSSFNWHEKDDFSDNYYKLGDQLDIEDIKGDWSPEELEHMNQILRDQPKVETYTSESLPDYMRTNRGYIKESISDTFKKKEISIQGKPISDYTVIMEWEDVDNGEIYHLFIDRENDVFKITEDGKVVAEGEMGGGGPRQFSMINDAVLNGFMAMMLKHGDSKEKEFKF